MTREKRIAVLDITTVGSTGKIATGICNYFQSKNIQTHFCYGMGDKPHVCYSYRIDTKIERYLHALLCRITGYQGYFSIYATKRLIAYLEKNNVNTIIALQLHGYYLNEKMFFSYINKADIRFVYIMIDEYPLYGKCGYKDDCINFLDGCKKCPKKKEYPTSWFFDRAENTFKDKQKSYAKLKNACFVGPEYVVKEAKRSPIIRNMNMRVLDEAIDTDLYSPRDTNDLREKLKIDKSKTIILCVAPSGKGYERKGTIYFINLARKLEKNDNYVFVHVGFTSAVDGLPSNYIPIGYISDQDILAQYYSLGDLFVFPSLLDTMPNTCLEALSCGTPLLCFNISGMPYLGNKDVLTLVEAKNVDDMVDIVLHTEKKSKLVIDNCRKYALKRYSQKNYCQKLDEILDEMYIESGD